VTTGMVALLALVIGMAGIMNPRAAWVLVFLAGAGFMIAQNF
jgi:hypothetical protein